MLRIYCNLRTGAAERMSTNPVCNTKEWEIRLKEKLCLFCPKKNKRNYPCHYCLPCSEQSGHLKYCECKDEIAAIKRNNREVPKENQAFFETKEWEIRLKEKLCLFCPKKNKRNYPCHYCLPCSEQSGHLKYCECKDEIAAIKRNNREVPKENQAFFETYGYKASGPEEVLRLLLNSWSAQ